MTKNYMTFGRLTFHEYLDQVDAVTGEQINRLASECLASMPSIVVQGSSINTVPTVTDVQRMLGQ